MININSRFVAFKAEVKKQLALRNWKYKDLALATGYTVGTIEALMCGARVNDTIAEIVAKTLGIPLSMAQMLQ